MMHYPRLSTRAWRGMCAAAIATTLVFAAACSHNPDPNDEIPYVAPPIIIHVKNENFADVNVAAVISGVSRRLGTVTGNGGSDFAIGYNVLNGQPLVLTAIQIGGRGSVTSPALSVGPGQVVEFKIGSVFRQSTATVHDP